MLRLVLCHELEISAPFVFHPDGVEVLIIRAKYKHYFRAVQCGKYVRLVFRTQFVLQRYPGEKHTITLRRQGVVYVLRYDTVDGAVTIFIRFFVADKNVVRRFLAGDLNNALANFLDCLGLIPVHAPGDGVSVLASLLKVGVIHDAVKRRTVTGGHFLSGRGVIHVFYAVFAKNQTPIGLGLGGKFGHDVLVHAGSLVKFAGHPQSVGAAE